MGQVVKYGESDSKTSQGCAYVSWGASLWTAHWQNNWNSHARTGNITYAYAAMNDFGDLFPLPPDQWPRLSK